LSAQVKSTTFYKPVQLILNADDINIMGRAKRALSEVYGELNEAAKEVGLSVNVEITKAMVQNRRLRRRAALTVRIMTFKWLGNLNTYGL
jgi:hypothetical protein